MIRSLSLGKTLCISNKYYKYYMAYLNISFQGNGTDSHSTNKKIMGGKVRAVRSKNKLHWRAQASVCHDWAWTWASYMQHLHNWNVRNIKREEETFTSYLVPLLDLLIHKARLSPFWVLFPVTGAKTSHNRDALLAAGGDRSGCLQDHLESGFLF